MSSFQLGVLTHFQKNHQMVKCTLPLKNTLFNQIMLGLIPKQLEKLAFG